MATEEELACCSLDMISNFLIILPVIDLLEVADLIHAQIKVQLANILHSSTQLGSSSLVSLDFPAALSQRVINALKADPKTVDLRAQAPHFYALGARILELFEEEEIVDVLLEVCVPFPPSRSPVPALIFYLPANRAGLLDIQEARSRHCRPRPQPARRSGRRGRFPQGLGRDGATAFPVCT